MPSRWKQRPLGGSPPALLRPKRPRLTMPVTTVAAMSGAPRKVTFLPPPPPPSPAPPLPPAPAKPSADTRSVRPSVLLGEAHHQLLPYWRQKRYALLWARLLVDLVTKQRKKNFTQAYKELAAMRWSRHFAVRRGQATAARSS